MRYSTTHTYDGMGEFLFRKWYDGTLEADDEFRDGHYYGFAQFGRRVIVDQEGTSIEYERFPTVADACRRMEKLHHDRPPTEWDAIIGWDRGYAVSIEGSYVGTFDERDEAVLALAREMVRTGCFPDAFETNDRGWYQRIDDEVRELHDAGGTAMRADLIATCRHCGRQVWRVGGRWIDPEATGDDSVWRETCDEHDTMIADHEPA